MIYPWQTAQWQQLQQQRSSQRLPHALLLRGADGLGKQDFATQVSASLLCRSPDANSIACGRCDACHLLAAGTHPDLLVLEPEQDKAIKVDEIRDLCNALSLTSQFGGYKVAIIFDADRMNINASNSLLKTLEEPTSDSILLLVTSKPYKLPVTIRSRCQSIDFHTPDQQIATQWLTTQTNQDMQLSLQLAHGAPLLALKLADDELLVQRQCLTDAFIGVANNKPVTSYSDRLSAFSNEYLLRWLYDWLSDLLKVKQSGSEQNLSHPDFAAELVKLAQRASVQALYQMLDEVLRLRQLQSIPLNNQMVWEDLLISWGRTVQGR